ncbi:MAG TPA: NAD(P)-dependent oxidoreductase [Nitrospirae bacterium]|nr:dTDP-4-dehydrorhamnose reductase [bacterium BMS3Abin06]HDH13441.1 NAD(P)-dependent oxidoreductase [Nitrospirota bacterium]HDZ01849.1 NAD(P)-dependent oxidoreductase [Nitrospirota bacterium]
MKRLLVTGASGFLGWNICNTNQKEWEIFGTFNSHPVVIAGTKTVQIDLTDFKELKRVFKEIRPDAVIHTAAASNPDFCQENPAESQKINVDTSLNIAGLCADRKIPLAFTSTDLVFDGLNAPYREEDPVSPVNVYGEQKVLAEEKIFQTYPLAAVCRMPLMFGNPGPAASSFFQSMINALKEGRGLRLFVDEFRTPISGKTAVQGLFLALNKVNGLIHLGGVERISRYNFGLLLMETLGIREAGFIQCQQKDIITTAHRPADVSLDSSKAFASGFKPLPLREELKSLLEPGA